MSHPINIRAAVVDYAQWDPAEAARNDTTNREIRDYFSPSNFRHMFGPEGADISDWPWTFEQLAKEAMQLRDEADAGPGIAEQDPAVARIMARVERDVGNSVLTTEEVEEIRLACRLESVPRVIRSHEALRACADNLRRVALEVAPQMEQWDGYLHKEDMLLGLATDLAIWAARLREAAGGGE